MSEEKILAHAAGENMQEVELSANALNELENKVRAALKEDVRSLTNIRKLLFTPDTFNHSLGNLYLYLEDQKLCQSQPCQGRCYLCPKKQKGYNFSLSYHKVRDEIGLELQMCPLQAEKDQALNLVQPCDHKREDLYYQYQSLMDTLHKGDNKDKLSDTYAAFMASMMLMKKQSKTPDKFIPAFAFHGINSSEYSKNILSAICYMFAKLGKHCSYIKTPDLFSGFFDKDFRTQELALQDYNHILNVDVLFLEDFNLYPKATYEFNSKYLFGLLRARHQAGKLTFVSLTQSVDLSNLMKRIFRDCDCLKEAQDIVSDLFEVKHIKDLDIR